MWFEQLNQVAKDCPFQDLRFGDRNSFSPGQNLCPEYLLNKLKNRPDAVAYACKPSNLGGYGGQIPCGQEFETSLANMTKPCLYYKYKKLARCGGGCL